MNLVFITWLSGKTFEQLPSSRINAINIRFRYYYFCLLFSILFLAQNTVGAATLSVAERKGIYPGDTSVKVPITLEVNGNELVAGIQADIEFASSELILESVLPGPAAEDAGKTVTSTNLAPGLTRIFLSGFNQTPIENGTVILLSFSVRDTASPGEYYLPLLNIKLVSPTGTMLEATMNTGIIMVKQNTGCTNAGTERVNYSTFLNALPFSLALILLLGVSRWQKHQRKYPKILSVKIAPKSSVLYFLMFFTVVSSSSLAATISVGSTSVSGPEIAYTLPINLIPAVGEEISATQFDMVFDTNALSFTSVEAGEQTLTAGKTVSFNTLENGSVRIIIAGLNLNTIGEGIIAHFHMVTKNTVVPGTYNVSAENILLSSPIGETINSESIPGTVFVEEFPSWNLYYQAIPLLGGTIIGPDSIAKTEGAIVTITVEANDGYVVENVLADNNATITGNGTYTLSNVTADTTISVYFFMNEGEGEGEGEGEIVLEGEPGEGEGEGEQPLPHPADLNKDFRIVMNEAIAYLSGWQQGSNPMSYAIRAAYLWQNGEYYIYDASISPPLCWILAPK